MNKIFLNLITIFFVFANSFSAVAGIDKNKIYSFIPSNARKKGNLGVYIKSLKTNEVIFDYNSKKNFIPASNNKIVSSFAALGLLGNDFRFKTEFYSGGEIHGSVLHGGLYVKGYGDPTIDHEALERIAKRLYLMGIREIRDGIYLDSSYFDKKNYQDGWKKEWRGDYYSPPVEAFSLNYNTFDVHVSPSKVGNRAHVTTDPQSSSLRIVNKTVTSSSRSAVVVRYNGNKELLVSGPVSKRWGKSKYTVSALEPTLYFGTVLRNALIEEGIKVGGGIRVENVPKWANKIFDFYSETLDSIIYEYNKESINIIGENLVKTLGAEFVGEPGSWENGNRVISSYLKEVGINSEFRIVDGSGLSVDNRISPKILGDILVKAYNNSEISKAFLPSLPIAGIDGTLEKRFLRTNIKGNVYAKTGYLNGVRSLSGYAFSSEGEIFVFSIISNGLGPITKIFQNKLLMELVNCCSS
ncbi:MAG: D-alanyl-D-alanine carboxypeptidase/D-alanyl-D-alanine-endopeptidase [Candidatus Dadabacteria bacterium]|nr:D-alanyl-D-alanine carboxypeptidase/D-alanyl-D-alanine-endopeptidase [Candidatus Dadabacteria bacterium]NIQ14078.1 D-alanyl-D-alanine carboxypeptidase/D-alanyl-D-alanine-endopeptidase [Candidatus Dadabacteria bacterium]